ncbi:MAG: Crp/Fnr family transcriptional regulator [Suilimivivens sp.]
MEHGMPYLLGIQELETIVRIFNPAIKNFKRGEIIFRKDVKESRFCFLLEGTAYLQIENEYDSKQILDYFVKGQVLCHDMLAEPHNGHCYLFAKYPCSIAYINPAEIISCSQAHKDDFLSRLPGFIFQSIMSVSQQHRHILQQKTIRNKLLSFFHYQVNLHDSHSFKLSIPCSDLADYLSVDRSAMMKELSRLCDDGIIEKKGRRIKLLV